MEKNIQTEEALRESEERYKTIFDKAPISIWEYDISDACKYMDSIKSSHITDYYSYLSENPDVFLKIISLLKLVDVNHETVKLYGARSKEDIVKKIGKNLIPQALEIYKNALIAFMMGQSHYVCESVNKTIDGRMINILHRITFSDETQKFKRALVTVTDITERKRAEETLRESENRFRSVVEQAGESIFIHDRNGKILDVNQRVCESLGYTRQELLSMSIEDVDVEFISREHKRFWTKLSSSRYVTFTGRHKRKDGSTFPIEVNLGFMELDKQKVYLALTRDITERKRLEEEHSKASKLESLGILSGGIAHDFNNILASILGNISLAKMNLNTKSQGYEMLTDAEKASLRAKDLTKQLLTFSKGGAPFKQPEQISELLKESAGFSVRGSNVRCDCLIPDDLWWAEIDKSQIYQVINNMIINAIQAMPMGGTIEVKADNIVLDNKDAIPLPGGNYVKIIIGDHGIGIPEEYINKIFDPYFTTKQQGSGLGLTTSYSIIKRHDGYIAVESEMGKGTVFEIYLPASKSIRKVDTDESEIDWHVPISGKILVMDDQENVRDVMIRMLNYLGNEVEFACDGAEAIELYKKACDGGKPFDAVIMDLTVPGAMGGLEATKLLLKNDPNARVIMSSGYSNDPVFSNFRRHGFMGIISKPFQFNELKEVLNDVLSRKK
ncbi:PAS domain S-box protein [bacterium]|nr:PAS domain S-box protein [bacterium]